MSLTQRVARSTNPALMCTFAQPEIVLPDEFFTVSVAAVYEKDAVSAKDFQACNASAAEQAMRGTAAPASKTAVGAGMAQLPCWAV